MAATRERSQLVNRALLKTREGNISVETMVDMIRNLPPGQLTVQATENEGMPNSPWFMTPVEYLLSRVSLIDPAVKSAFFARPDFDPNLETPRTFTPFIKLILNEDYPSVRQLLDSHNIDLNKMVRHRTALDFAQKMLSNTPRNQKRKVQRLIDTLIERGAKTEAQLLEQPDEVPPEAAAGEQAPALAVPPEAAAGQQAPALAVPPEAAAGQQAPALAVPPGAAAGQQAPALAVPPGAAAGQQAPALAVPPGAAAGQQAPGAAPTPEQRRKTALLVDAIQDNNFDEALGLILDPTVDINNSQDEGGEELSTPLINALENGAPPEIYDALLGRPDLDINKQGPLFVAVVLMDADIVEKILNSGKPVLINATKHGGTALDLAFGYGGEEMERIRDALISRGARRAEDLMYPPELSHEATDDVLDLLDNLYSRRVSVNVVIDAINRLPLEQINVPASERTMERPLPIYHYIVKHLFDRVNDPNLIHTIVSRIDFDPNTQDFGGYTPVMLAILKKDFNSIETLLIRPENATHKVINLDLKSSDGNTALDHAKIMREKAVGEEQAQWDEVIRLIDAIASAPSGAAGATLGPMWKGYDESDLLLVNAMFSVPDPQPGKETTELIQEQIRAFSICPVCLRVATRGSGCMFMRHVCKPPHNKDLYRKYSDTSEGITEIEWCTICGRICKDHKHYEIGKSDGPVPKFASTKVVDVRAFGSDCKRLGGGGIEEKLLRIQRMVDKICELQSQIGKISDQEARNAITTEMWDSALEEPDPALLVEIMETKSFRFDERCKALLNKPQTEKKETVYADIERPADEKGLTPDKYDNTSKIQYSPATIALRKKATDTPDSSSQKEAFESAATAAETAEKLNYCAPELGVHDDDRATYGFRHKQPGSENVLNHGLVKEDDVYTERYCGEHLEELLRSVNIQDTKGKCPLSENCNAKLYPEEIKGIVSDQYYENYKRIFNEVNAIQKGGQQGSPIFAPLTDWQEFCPLPQKGGKNRRTRRGKKARKTRKRV
jgi:hypothetical protein